MKEARFYTVEDGGVQCQLCPHHCHIKEGRRGLCRSRFFPRYRFLDAAPTPKATLLMARDIARSFGIKNIYLGNV